MDEAPARAIEPGQQAAPDVTAGPKSFAGNGIVDSEIGVGRPVTKMEGQIRSESPVLGGTGQPFRFDFRGKDKDQIRLVAVSDYLEAAPSFELPEGITTHGSEPGLIFEIDKFGGQETPRQIAMVLCLNCGK